MITHFINYINWAPSEIAFQIGGFGFRWYSLCWLIGLVLAFLIVRRLYKEQKIKDELFDPLLIYCFLGIIIGARLGHCFFYEPDVYLSSWDRFLEVFLPMKHTAEGWKFTGYEGLASHGGTIGIILALLLYCHNKKMKIMTVLDTISISCQSLHASSDWAT